MMASHTRSPTGALPALALLLSLLLGLIVLFPAPALAQQTEPAIYNASDKYIYQGCYNETTDIAGTSGDRALSDGTHLIGAGNMTVPECLAFCSSNGTAYKYAGLEYARECWCSQHLSGLSVKFADSACDLGCDGDQTQVCGGALKLSVYELSGAASVKAMSGVMVLCLAGAAALNLI